MSYHLVCDKSNTTGITSRVGTDDASRAREFTLEISGVRVVRSLVFRVMFCRSLFVLFSSISFVHCIFCPSIYGY